MSLLDEVRKVVREYGTYFDGELYSLIEAAKLDLLDKGVMSTKVTTPDDYVTHAIKLYAKANFGYDDPVIKQDYMNSYESLVNRLCISTAYREPEAGT